MDADEYKLDVRREIILPYNVSSALLFSSDSGPGDGSFSLLLFALPRCAASQEGKINQAMFLRLRTCASTGREWRREALRGIQRVGMAGRQEVGMKRTGKRRRYGLAALDWAY